MVDQLDEARNTVLTENTAHTIFKTLKRLEDNRDRFKTRWVWELLQNACDSADHTGVAVRINFNDASVVFSHDGDPFNEKDVAHLIYHGTTKYEDDDSIGNFGTGFLSTHLISKTVDVRGQMADGRTFSFQLNREAGSPKELQAVNESTWDEFKDSLGSSAMPEETSFTTEFTYPILDSNTRDTVDQGLHDLEKNLLYVFAFNKRLNSIQISRSGEITEISTKDPEQLADQIFYCPIQERRNSQKIRARAVLVRKGDGLSVAIPVSQTQERSIESLGSTPKLFVSFPLLGTEHFAFPAVINSSAFIPTENRDGISLRSEDTATNNINKKLISEACNLMTDLLRYASKSGLRSTHKLVAIDDICKCEWFDDTDWYSSLVKDNLISEFRNIPLLPNTLGEYIRALDSWIPADSLAGSEPRIWELAAKLRAGADKLPLKCEAGDWAQVLYRWRNLLDVPVDKMEESLTIDKLARMVSECGEISSLEGKMVEGTNVYEWLDCLYILLFEASLIHRFDEIKILPNQHGLVRSRNDLFIDCKDGDHVGTRIDEDLKNIAEDFGLNIRDELLDNNVKWQEVRNLLKARNESSVLGEVVEANKDGASAEERLTEIYEKANIRLFNWILSHGALKHFESFPVFTESNKDDCRILRLSSTQDEDNIPLAPIGCWPKSAQPYGDLFPERHILASGYLTSSVRIEAWDELANRGYLRISPVYETEETLKRFLPDEPLSEEKGTTHSANEVRVSRIAYLRKGDVGIIDRVRKSEKRALEFINFLVKCVLEVDVSALETLETHCECGGEHKYYRAAWLIPLTERKWVPVGDKKRDVLNSETLATLLASEPELVESLGHGKPAKLMEALGINLSTLSLQVLADTEADRLSFIQSITDIAEAAGRDPEKVREIAQEIKEFPCILDDIKEKKEQRRVIKRNQAVGAMVESYFKRALEAQGFKVTRTYVGSDFEIEYDLIENDQETLFRISRDTKSYLIEIKSTTGKVVRMSLPQARKASEEKDRYVLFFVQLHTDEPSEADIAAHGRFCFDIAGPIEVLLNQYDGLDVFRECTTTQEGDIHLEIEPLHSSLRIGFETWEDGLELNEALQRFIAE